MHTLKVFILMTFLFNISLAYSEVTWDKLVVPNQYIVQKKFLVAGVFDLAPGTIMKFEKKSYMTILGLEVFRFKILTCSNPTLEAEMDLYSYDVAGVSYEVGIEIQKNCIFDFYIGKDETNLVSIF